MDGDLDTESTAELPPEPPEPPHPPAHAGADAARTTARVTARATAGTLRATGHGLRNAFRLARRASHAEGAGESGFFRIIELHAFNAAGDAAVTISLAGTLFFQVPSGDDAARGHVALFLGLTMMPFAIVAPLIGPFLDRFSHGRRWAIGATFAIRGLLCWILAGLVADESLGMFPAALGVLVASKAYGVTRAAAVPRVVPDELGLVRANSRISLAGLVGVGVSAPLALLASLIGPEWSLRYAFLVFAGGTILAILLPKQVDNSRGEEGLRHADGGRMQVPAVVVTGLRANSGIRMLSGFLTLFLAFLLRAEPFDVWPHKGTIIMGMVVGAAGLGNAVGIALGNLLRRINPGFTVRVALLADGAAAILAAVHWSFTTALILGLTAGIAQAIAKLSLDSMIQSEISDAHRSSMFARSETLLQLSWVVGAFLGIALPLKAQLGMFVISAALVAVMVWLFAGNRLTRAADVDPVDDAVED